MSSTVQLVPAHAEGLGHTAGEVALTVVMVAAVLVPLILIGVVAVVFYRAAKRDERSEGRT